MKPATIAIALALAITSAPFLASPRGAQLSGPSTVDGLHRPLDEILDLYVRDGLVYYFALRQERGKLDRYVASLGEVSADTVKSWPRERQLAYRAFMRAHGLPVKNRVSPAALASSRVMTGPV